MAFELIWGRKAGGQSAQMRVRAGGRWAAVLTSEALFELGRGGHVHRALAVTVGDGGVGAVAEQQ